MAEAEAGKDDLPAGGERPGGGSDRDRVPDLASSVRPGGEGGAGQDRQDAAGERPGGERAEEDASAFPSTHQVQQLAQAFLPAGDTRGEVQQSGPVIGSETYGYVGTVNRTQIVVPGGGSARVAVGSVRPELLTKVEQVFVAAACYQRALHVLRSQRVVVLQGRAHWGKATTALRLLLDACALDPDRTQQMLAIAPNVQLETLTEDFFEDGGAYVVDTLAPAGAGALHVSLLSYLSDRLEETAGYLAITVDGRSAIPRTALRDYLVLCTTIPDPEEVLRQNLRWHLRDGGHSDGLAELAWVQRQVRQRPLPGQLDQLAEVLADLVRGRIAEADAPADYARRVRLRVQEWFESHPELPERCLMVAAAVLNGSSYHEVADSAYRLRLLLEPPPEEDQPPRPGWRFGSSRTQIVEDICGQVVLERQPTNLGTSPREVLQLDDVNLQREVLEHVWFEHDAVRGPLLEWLSELGGHRSPEIRQRAAVAVGALCLKDFVYIYNRIVLDWAASPRVAEGISAAVALNMVANADDELASQVRTLLQRWVLHDPRSALAWTATAAFGLQVGQRWPEHALRALRAVVEQAPEYAWAASRSIANLCEAGRAGVVLEAIEEWAGCDDPRATARCLRAFVRTMRVGGGDGVVASGARDGDRDGVVTPVLLRLAASDQEVLDQVLRLWREALDRHETYEQALAALRHWLLLADEDDHTRQALDAVASDLLSGTINQQRELVVALEEWADDPRFPSITAKRYHTALLAVLD
jgi:hypothetical protein